MVANAGVPPGRGAGRDGRAPGLLRRRPGHAHPGSRRDRPTRVTPRTRAVLVVHLYRPAGADAGDRRAGPRARPEGPGRLRPGPRRALGWSSASARSATRPRSASIRPRTWVRWATPAPCSRADPDVADRARLLRMYGWRQRYISEVHSTVSRLDELQAALLSAKLPHLDAWNAARQRLAERYRAGLERTGRAAARRTASSTCSSSALRTARRAAGRYLAEHGVGTDMHYPLPAHLQAPYRRVRERAGALPQTERLADEILSLPIYPELSEADVDYVVDQVALARVMEREQYAIMARREERHWWYAGMRRVALAVLDRALAGRTRTAHPGRWLRHRRDHHRAAALRRGRRRRPGLGSAGAGARPRPARAGAGVDRAPALRAAAASTSPPASRSSTTSASAATRRR